ncbi:MAG: hypothetical protein KDC38_09200 [Planctomycetes bacterium]|nr:hypothetical protein [Planctomycetota bacterium]
MDPRLRLLLRLTMGIAAWTLSLSVAPRSFAQSNLAFGDPVIPGIGAAAVPVSLTHPQDVQAFTLSAMFDPALLEVVSIGIEGTATEPTMPDLVFPEVFPIEGGFILGVFIDTTPPFDGQAIPSGIDVPVAVVEVRSLVSVASPISTPLVWIDDVFGSPSVANTIFDATGTTGAAQGLTWTDGTISLVPALLQYSVPASVATDSLGAATVPVRLDNDQGPVSAYTVTLDHGAALILESIDIDATAAFAVGAESVDTTIGSSSGVLEVVFDAVPPFDGQTLPVGTELTIANFSYVCDDVPILPAPSETVAIEFSGIDTVTIGGLPFTPSVENGSVVCVAQPAPDTAFRIGTATGAPLLAAPGQTIPVTFLVADPSDGLQGFQMGITFGCEAMATSLFEVTGEASQAEFVDSNYDNDPLDGDGCELVIGVLLDALPPFDDPLLPVSADPYPVGSVQFEIDRSTAPGTEIPLEFAEVGGEGSVIIENIAVIDFASIEVVDLVGTHITVVDGFPFRRGDVTDDGMLDLSDGIGLLAQLFEAAPIPCFGTSDIDGDDALSLDDFMLLAIYLYQDGPPPAAPFPECAVVPGTPCATFSSCP